MSQKQDRLLADAVGEPLTAGRANRLAEAFDSAPAAVGEFLDQSQTDAELRMASGWLAPASPVVLVRRVRLAVWHRRLRKALELAIAAMIVIGLTLSCVLIVRQSQRSKAIEPVQPPTKIKQPATKEPGRTGATLPAVPVPPGGD